MSRQMIMGNQAIALGALKAGVNLVAGYPGTPSSEIIEFISKYNKKTGTYVEWSVNEKAAVEVAAGASYAGSRTLVTMKQVGLNVASDPVMCLSYVGVKGGMVIVSADDPGPISSQTEQDTRNFAQYSKIPCFDPSTPLEAYEMVQEAFELSEKYNTPVLLRPTTRVDHAYESMDFPELSPCRAAGEFIKDSKRWVIFPRSSYNNHIRIFERNESILPQEFSDSKWNKVVDLGGESLPLAAAADASSATPSSGAHPRNAPVFAAGGISYCYLMEALEILRNENPDNKAFQDVEVLKIGTPYPFPSPMAAKFMKAHDEITVFEELDPVIEDALIHLCGTEKIDCSIHGKHDRTVPEAGELSVEIVKDIIEKMVCPAASDDAVEKSVEAPALPVRPPVLCAGCPHRGSFYAVKQAMKGKKTAYCGDIGCYTLGNAMPLDMTDTCLCMGADITMAQGFYHNEKDRHCFSFIGDSTFFASGITGVVNAVYNQSKQTICILDNSTTAMTGHQPHPGTGVTMMGEFVEKISIPKILEAIGVNPIIEVDPFDQEKSVAAVKEATEAPGVSAIIFKSPCISIAGKLGYRFPGTKNVDNEKCIGCRKCINELGCPALSLSTKTNSKGKQLVEIDRTLCTGCGLCAGVCPVKAIG
ncbi:indolepyruvate ferredoxin oxidoreductase subunit alpha [Treponema sp.]|uniref:indolepyruvate ferredoxin oxidoreductase subunit alpha n=1 Tax=Treponema sp. TaxID=166 RepID=UPI00298E8DAC|nr:indolepyruvate ferredoxin oxidoreductase subunit alpha [Treponema sp.]MCQ2242320.1 indolepyruvate ferredoxin oxidoreductase subunit alpha [Treponema sp.]